MAKGVSPWVFWYTLQETENLAFLDRVLDITSFRSPLLRTL